MSMNKKLMGSMPEWNVGTFTDTFAVAAGAVVDLMATIQGLQQARVTAGLTGGSISYVHLTAAGGDVLLGDFRGLSGGEDGMPILTWIAAPAAGGQLPNFGLQIGNGRPALTSIGGTDVVFTAFTEK